MKTASVRDLRNHFAQVAKWIESGEAVSILRNGVAFATLAPASSPRPKVGWGKRLAERSPLGREMSPNETDEFWTNLRD